MQFWTTLFLNDFFTCLLKDYESWLLFESMILILNETLLQKCRPASSWFSYENMGMRLNWISYACKQQEVLERTNRLLSLIRHGPHWKRHVQQFFHRCVCIRYRGNVSTEPMPSTDRGIYIEPLPSNDRGNTHTHEQQRDLISLLYVFRNKESRLKTD
jgi:hypothetical protein